MAQVRKDSGLGPEEVRTGPGISGVGPGSSSQVLVFPGPQNRSSGPAPVKTGYIGLDPETTGQVVDPSVHVEDNGTQRYRAHALLQRILIPRAPGRFQTNPEEIKSNYGNQG